MRIRQELDARLEQLAMDERFDEIVGDAPTTPRAYYGAMYMSASDPMLLHYGSERIDLPANSRPNYDPARAFWASEGVELGSAALLGAMLALNADEQSGTE